MQRKKKKQAILVGRVQTVPLSLTRFRTLSSVSCLVNTTHVISNIMMKVIELVFVLELREMPVPLWSHWWAAQPHAWSEPAGEVWHWLYQHGGEDNARKQRSLKVSNPFFPFFFQMYSNCQMYVIKCAITVIIFTVIKRICMMCYLFSLELSSW